MARRARSSSVFGRSVVVGIVLAVVAGYGPWGVLDVASAASLAGSTFEIEDDANLVVDAGGVDWANGGTTTPGVDVDADKASGGSDDSFTGGTHEDSAVPTVDAGSIPPNKSDLKGFGLYVESTPTKVFLNVFWSRVQNPNGDTNMDFEFNQSATNKNKPVGSAQIIPVRTKGDLLLTYDLSNGGAHASMSKRFWGGTSWGPATALTGTQALAGINDTAITAANSGGLGPFSARTFGEASVDLSTLIPVDQGCITYGSVYLKSRSSDSFNSELKDFIAPMSASISNCGTVKVHKTDANGPLAGAGFTLYKDAAPTGGARGAEDTVSAGTCSTAANGNCSITDVKKGDYWMVETTVPFGHDPAPDQHVSIISGDQVVSLSFVDPIQTGTITVIKDAVPNDAQDFTFNLGGSAFSLDDDANGTLPSTRSFTVPVGTHTLTETSIPGNWDLTGLDCDDPTKNTTTSLQNETATVVLAKNETVACTFTNTYTPGTVGLSTAATSAGNDFWDDVATLTGDGSHAVTGTVGFYACAPAATQTACTTGGTKVGTDVAVTPAGGSSFTAKTSQTYMANSAGWTCFRAEFTSTSAFYADKKHTNTTSECFLLQWKDLSVSATATPAVHRAYTWTIGKSVDASSVRVAAGGSAVSTYTVTAGTSGVQDSGWAVTGSITVTNPNPVPFTSVVVTDVIDNGGTCTVTGGASVTVPANGTAVLPYSCSYAAAPFPADGTDTATASWDAVANVTPHGTATVDVDADFDAATPSVSDASIDVTDSVVGPLGTVSALSGPNPRTFTYTVTHTGVAGACTSYPNTATFTTSTTQTSGSASASVSVCVGSDLTGSMTAAGAYGRVDGWELTKDVDKTTVTADSGTTATFGYTVTATPSGTSEGGHSLSGSVTVANPNSWEAVVADVVVSSDLGGGSDCAVTGGDNASVPAAGSVSLAYACAFTGVPAHTGTVSAAVTWDGAAASTPGSSTGATAPAELVLSAETDATVTVVDDKTDPANPVELGTADWADGPTVFTYTLDKTVATSDCVTYTNTASIRETGQEATQDVEVCGTFTGGGGTVTPPPAQGGGLPFTGDHVGLLVRAGLGLLLAGCAILLVSRKRRSA